MHKKHPVQLLESQLVDPREEGEKTSEKVVEKGRRSSFFIQLLELRSSLCASACYFFHVSTRSCCFYFFFFFLLYDTPDALEEENIRHTLKKIKFLHPACRDTIKFNLLKKFRTGQYISKTYDIHLAKTNWTAKFAYSALNISNYKPNILSWGSESICHVFALQHWLKTYTTGSQEKEWDKEILFYTYL